MQYYACIAIYWFPGKELAILNYLKKDFKTKKRSPPVSNRCRNLAVSLLRFLGYAPVRSVLVFYKKKQNLKSEWIWYWHLCASFINVRRLDYQCKRSRPREGILRVEVMRDVPESYSLKDSYEKERKLQLAQRQNEEIYGFFPPEGWVSSL